MTDTTLSTETIAAVLAQFNLTIETATALSVLQQVFTLSISKLNESRDLDITKIPPQSFAYIFDYGLGKCVNDSHASIKRADFANDELWHAAVLKPVNTRWEQIQTGKVPTARVKSTPAMTAEKAIAALLKAGYTQDQVKEMMAAAASKISPAAAEPTAPAPEPAEIVPLEKVKETQRRNRGNK